jgi:hypothetical protein
VQIHNGLGPSSPSLWDQWGRTNDVGTGKFKQSSGVGQKLAKCEQVDRSEVEDCVDADHFCYYYKHLINLKNT